MNRRYFLGEFRYVEIQARVVNDDDAADRERRQAVGNLESAAVEREPHRCPPGVHVRG